MPEKKTKVLIPGQGEQPGTEVLVTESTERFSELRLEDGSVLRVKPLIMGVVRVDNQWDQEGNPMYAIKGGQIATIVSVPEHLRKPKQASEGVH